MRSLQFVKAKKCIALLAAAALSVAAGGADAAFLRDTDTSYALTAYAEDPTEAPDVDTTKLLEDCFGEVVMYRWHHITYKDAEHRLPKDGELHPIMMIWPAGYYLAGEAPGCIWYSKNSPGNVTGIDASHYLPSLADFNSYFAGSDHVDESITYYIDSRNTIKDTQINPLADIFYTTDDRDVVYMRSTGGTDDDNKNDDGSYAIEVNLKLKSTNGSDYWIYPEDSKRLYIKTSEPTGHPWFFRQDTNNWNGTSTQTFNIQYNKSSDDSKLVIKKGWGHVRNKYNEDGHPVVYIGEKLRFSSIKGGTTVSADSILSITPGRYISTTGEGEPATGVILPEGETLTIEKGGVLSVSGQFINNGTIVNNGTILIRDGGSIFPFLQGSNTNKKGCGKILCNGGDIIVKEGGALFAGLQDEKRNRVAFRLDAASTLVNMGLLVYGGLEIGNNARVELYDTSVTYGGVRFCYANSSVSNSMWSDYQKMEAMPSDYISQLLDVPGYTFTEQVGQSYHCCGNMYQTYNVLLSAAQRVGLADKYGMYLSSGVGSNGKYHVVIQEGAENRLNDPFLKDSGIVTETMGI